MPENAGGDREEGAGLDGEDRHHAHADDIAFGATGAGKLGVLLKPHHCQVCADQRENDRRQDQHVQRVQPRNQRDAGKVAAEEGPVQPGANQRKSQHD